MAELEPQKFDIIIIGGGTAGLVIANRLSEIADLNILILEAGPNRNDDSMVSTPGFVAQIYVDPKYNWFSETVPQKELNGRTINYSRGKLLGGSSAINMMAVIYPSRKVFDVWSKYGNKGWDAESMAPYLKKWEGAHSPSKKTAEELRIESYRDPSLPGTGGPVSTAFPEWYLPLSPMWMKTMENLGLKSKVDLVSGEAVGACEMPSYIDPRTKTRHHAGVAYWEPVRTRKNLKLQEGALVERILLEKNTEGIPVAKGVQYSIDGTPHTALANREIILSAGAYGSPAILEMSGIGKPDILQPLGIDVVVSNTGVGENLQDHTMTFVSQEVLNPDDTVDALGLPGRFEAAMQSYVKDRDGPLSVGLSDIAFMPVVAGMDDDEKKAFLQLVDQTVETIQMNSAEKIRAEYYKSIVTSESGTTGFLGLLPFSTIVSPEEGEKIFGFSLVYSIICPFSRGSTHIQSKDPMKTALIDPKYLSHPVDMEILAHHILFTKKFFATEPFKSLMKPNGRTNVPATMAGPSGLPETLEQAKAWARAGTGTQYHACGTCSMMPQTMGGVVDDRLRVHGVKGLRVCDASIFPVIPKGPITSSVYAVAEKAADIIKEDLGC